MPASLSLLLLLAAGTAHALPFGSGQQVVLSPSLSSAADHPLAIHNELDPLRRAFPSHASSPDRASYQQRLM